MLDIYMHLDFIMIIWYFRPMARGRISYPCTSYNVNMPRLWNWHMNSLIFFFACFFVRDLIFSNHIDCACVFFPFVFCAIGVWTLGNWLSGKQRRREKMRERKKEKPTVGTLRRKNTRHFFPLCLFFIFIFRIYGFMHFKYHLSHMDS